MNTQQLRDHNVYSHITHICIHRIHYTNNHYAKYFTTQLIAKQSVRIPLSKSAIRLLHAFAQTKEFSYIKRNHSLVSVTKVDVIMMVLSE